MLMTSLIGKLYGLSDPLSVASKIRETLSWLIGKLQESNSLPSIFQNIGLALLSILIPLAIAVLTDVYQKKGKQESDFSQLDLQVILDNVFRIKRLLVYSLLIFLPFAFWEITSGAIRLLAIILSIAGVCFVTRIILNVYSWTKGNVSTFRLSYLKELRNPEDEEIAWRSVWNSRMDSPSELGFFRIFASRIDEMVKQNERKRSDFSKTSI